MSYLHAPRYIVDLVNPYMLFSMPVEPGSDQLDRVGVGIVGLPQENGSAARRSAQYQPMGRLRDMEATAAVWQRI